MKNYTLKDCLRRQNGMSKYALNLKNILSWYDTELTKAKKRIWKMKDLLDYEKSISDQKQNEINLKYREVIALQEHIEELEKENAEVKERCNILDKSLVTSTKNNIKRQKIIDELKEKNAELQGSERYRPKWHKVADGDLPKGNCENILLYNKDHFCVTHSYSLGYYENGVFYNDCEMEEDTIAWCEIPQYTKE